MLAPKTNVFGSLESSPGEAIGVGVGRPGREHKLSCVVDSKLHSGGNA